VTAKAMAKGLPVVGVKWRIRCAAARYGYASLRVRCLRSHVFCPRQDGLNDLGDKRMADAFTRMGPGWRDQVLPQLADVAARAA
jgi:hypothetical protein